MKTHVEAPRRPRSVLISMLWIVCYASAQFVHAGDPVLRAPGPAAGHKAPPIVYSEVQPYHGPFGGGPRVYGLREFHPPGKDIYEPPPVYKPRSYYPVPLWPYGGYYGYWGNYGAGGYPFGVYYPARSGYFGY